MSVNVLYCEGNSGSYDLIVIRQLLPKCEIRPLGGRTFMEKIIADRAINPNLAGLVDRDFDDYNFTPTNSPLIYTYEGVHIGWKWQRKEIENYLIDPVVVRCALGKKAPQRDLYQEALDEAARGIAVYTAARTALACFKFRNSWGDPIKQVFGSVHNFPKRLSLEACQQNIRDIVSKNKGDRIVTPEDVLNRFEDLLPSFRPDGFKFENYLTFFAGKDLLLMMRNKLTQFGFESTTATVHNPVPVFLERIVKRIERAEDVWLWLPEWQTLREEFINASF